MSTATATPTTILEDELRRLVEPQRAEFARWYAEYLEQGLRHAVEGRKPNETVAERFPSGWQPRGLVEVTDWYEAERSALQAHYRQPGYARIKRGEGPDFVVSFKPNFAAWIARESELEAENILSLFLKRTLEKLGPAVERKPSYVVTTLEGRIRDSAWQGRIEFTFADKTSFTVFLQIIFNTSVLGKPFCQYPLTIRGARLSPWEQQSRSRVSVEELWASVGYRPQVASKAVRHRWTKLAIGSVVLVDGRPVLVASTRQIKKENLDGSEQVARITPYSTYARIDFVDCTHRRVVFSDEQIREIKAIEDRGSFQKSNDQKRQWAFLAHYGPEGA